MLCTVELELASLCISIPMLRPFYIRLRERYKSQYSSTEGQSSYAKASQRAQLAGNAPGQYTVWMELVFSHSLLPFALQAVLTDPF